MHPQESSKGLDVKKAHEEALARHFDINKTLKILKEHLYWPKIGQDVHKVISRCSISHMAKSYFHQGLYTAFLVPLRPWDNLSVDFIWAFYKPLEGRMPSW